MRSEHRKLMDTTKKINPQTFANVDEDLLRLNKSLTELLRGVNYMLAITQRNIEAVSRSSSFKYCRHCSHGSFSYLVSRHFRTAWR